MVEMPEYIYACHMICSIYCLLHFGKLILKKLKASSPKKKDTEKYLTLECMECNYCKVKSLKEKMANVEKLRTGIEKQLEAIDALPQSILRKAFRGEL